MATAESVKAKLQGLIDQANVATGGSDADLTTALGRLIAGFGSGDAGGLAYDMGEFVLEADSVGGESGPQIYHNLVELPGFILVWTDDYVGVTNPDPAYGTNLGFAWMDRIMGLENWFTSAAYGDGTTVNFTQSKGSTGMNVLKPNARTYTMSVEGGTGNAKATPEYFNLVKTNPNNYYRAGTIYKYFASRAWWNIGGVASAE